MNKACRRCNTEKSLDMFGNRRIAKDGKKSWCKPCEVEAAKVRRLANPDRAKEIGKKSREKHSAARAKNTKDWRQKNIEHVKAYAKTYKQKPCVKEAGRLREEKRRRDNGVPKQTRQSREDELKKANLRAKEYYKENKPKIREYKAKWANRKLKIDIQFRLKLRLSSRIYNALNGLERSGTNLELIGTDIDGVMAHLESQFQDGISWDNYGEWHVDHIRPCAAFDLSDPQQQRDCFNYKNLQPLWAIDNYSKGGRF